ALTTITQHVAVGIAVQVLAHLAQRVERIFQLLLPREAGAQPHRRPLQNLKASALAEKSAQSVHDLGESAVGFTRNNLVGTELVKHLVGDVAQIERVQHSHAEIYGEFQSRLARLGLDTLILRK